MSESRSKDRVFIAATSFTVLFSVVGLALYGLPFYYDYMVDYYRPRRHDPGLDEVLADPLETLRRIIARFRDLDRLRATPEAPIAPITLMLASDGTGGRILMREVDADEPTEVQLIDGWHRLFAAALAGRQELDAELVSIGK